MGKVGWLYGVKAIADHLGVTDRTVRRWMKTRPDFPARRVGGRIFALAEELEKWTTSETMAA